MHAQHTLLSLADWTCLPQLNDAKPHILMAPLPPPPADPIQEIHLVGKAFGTGPDAVAAALLDAQQRSGLFPAIRAGAEKA